MLPELIAGGIQGLYGIYSSERARQQAAKLVKPNGYEITPEMNRSYNRAEQMALSGYTPAEKGSFYQNLASQSNQGYQRALRSSGGNQWSGAILAGVQSPMYGALENFAAKDASLQRQNVHYADQIGAQLSAQRNRNTALQWNNYNALQSAYGQARKAGIENVMNAGWLAAGAAGKAGAGAAGKTTPYGYGTAPYGTINNGDSYSSPDETPVT